MSWVLEYAIVSTVLSVAVLSLKRRMNVGWYESLLWLALTLPVVAAVAPQSGTIEPIRVVAPSRLAVALEQKTASGRKERVPVELIALSIWLSVAGLLVVRDIERRHRLLRLLDRRAATDVELRDVAAAVSRQIGLKRPVELSVSDVLTQPVAIGSREVCLPEGLEALDQRAVLAHEIAHLLRRDAWRELAARAIARLFWWQPLNLRLAHELGACAELLADTLAQRAVERTTLAATLLRFAEREVSKRASLLGMPAFPARPLRIRVERLLADDVVPEASVWVRGGFGIALGVAVLTLLPGARVVAGDATQLVQPNIVAAGPPARNSQTSREVGAEEAALLQTRTALARSNAEIGAPDPNTRAAIDDPVVAALRGLLSDTSIHVREAARESLDRIGTSAAEAALRNDPRREADRNEKRVNE